MSSLPSDAIVETLGPSDLGKGMIEVSWERKRYVVFEIDLTSRATLEAVEEALSVASSDGPLSVHRLA